MLRSIAKTVIVVMLTAGCFWIPTARGQDHRTYQASIPFAFYISDMQLPAGTYQITQPAQNVLLFHNAQGVAIAYQIIFPTELAAKASTGQLTFSEYGSDYFFQQFSAPDKSSGPHMASTCVRGKKEKRIAKQFADRNNREIAFATLPQK